MKSKLSALLLGLLVLAGLTAYLLRTTPQDGVEDAVLRSQEQLAVDVARSMADTVADTTANLNAEAALPTLGNDDWHPIGRALVDGKSRTLLSAWGPLLPLDKLPATAEASVTPLPEAAPKLLVSVPAPGDRLLVTAAPLELPVVPVDGTRAQSLVLLDSTGKIIHKRGATPQTQTPLVRAAEYAAQPGSIVQGETVVAFAPVTSEHLKGFTVASVLKVEKADRLTTWPGLIPAAALAGIALLGLVLIRKPKVAAVVLAVGVLGWSAALAALIGVRQAEVPAAAAAAHQVRVGVAVDAFLRNIGGLQGSVSLEGVGDPQAVRPALERIAAQGRFRNLSIVDDSGTTLLSVGQPALRTPGPLSAEGILRLPDDTNPVFYGHGATWFNGKFRLVTELDPEYLKAALRRVPGDVRLVDKNLRTVVGNEADEPVKQAVAAAFKGKNDARVENGAVIAARATDTDTGAESRLALASSLPVSEANPAGTTQRRIAWGLAAAGVLLAVLSVVTRSRS